MNFKEIHIGNIIKSLWEKSDISMERTQNFFKLDKEDILKMFQHSNIDCESLLKWSKLLEYDFFRLYSQHLILYAPQASMHCDSAVKQTNLPQFRKNLYTPNVIYFILQLIKKGEKTKQEIIREYRIPKTTLYKWIDKYSENK